MAKPTPKGLQTTLTVLAEVAVGSIPLFWLWYPPVAWAGFLIVPAINLSAFVFLAIIAQLLWPRRKGQDNTTDGR